MENEPRIYLDKWLFRIDRGNKQLIAFGDRDNVISFEDLIHVNQLYSGRIHHKTGQLDSTLDFDGREFAIPEKFLKDGYQEGSEFASVFNRIAKYYDYNIKLVDEELLRELSEKPLIYKHRTLPEMDFAGLTVVVDVSYGELRDKANPYNSIRFDDMDYNVQGRFYSFRLNTETGVFEPRHTETHTLPISEKQMELIEVEQMLVLDPVGMSIKYGIDESSFPEHDWELIADPEGLSRRIFDLELPIVRIIDEDYMVNLRNMELRSTVSPNRIIDLSEVPIGEDMKFELFYDYINRRAVKIPNNALKLPKNVVMVRILDPARLDPLGYKKLIDLSHKNYLSNEPQQQFMEASVFPLSQSRIAQTVRENVEKRENRIKRPDAQKQSKNGKGRGV